MKKPFIARFLKSILFVILVFYGLKSHAQEQVQNQAQKSEFWSHVQFGGGIGLSFGSGFFSGTLAPSGIYRVNEKFATGVGLNLSYSNEKNIYESYILGASILGLYNVIPQVQLSAEFEQLYVNKSDLNPICNGFDCYPLDESYWYPGLYVGAGFNTGPVTMGIRFDVLYVKGKSIYASAYVPFVRFYF
ncbi:MAG: alpha-ketoglutarate decarboxylase [Bacteroidetes bacterium]|nr:alpha-ketoglutarate decarboxylase [Bacteroidota bacterium]